MPDNGLPKKVDKMLARSLEDGRTIRVRRHTRTVFSVQSLTKPGAFRRVNLAAMKCSCRFFEEFGVPCRHLCAAALLVKTDPQQFIIPERRLDSLRATYVGTLTPVDTVFLQNDGTMPPTVTRRRGRQREKRIPSCIEKCHKRSVKCSNCNGRGHNARTCKAPRREQTVQPPQQ